MYTFRWTGLCDVIRDQDPADDVVRSPMNQDPIVLLPQDQRDHVLERINENLDAPYTIRNEQSLDPASEFYMDHVMAYINDDTIEDEIGSKRASHGKIDPAAGRVERSSIKTESADRADSRSKRRRAFSGSTTAFYETTPTYPMRQFASQGRTPACLPQAVLLGTHKELSLKRTNAQGRRHENSDGKAADRTEGAVDETEVLREGLQDYLVIAGGCGSRAYCWSIINNRIQLSFLETTPYYHLLIYQKMMIAVAVIG